MRMRPQSSHRSTWPPSAAVRQTSMAAMTRRWSGESRPPCAARNASPWRRKMSATSSAGRIAPTLRGRSHLERKPIEWARRRGDQAGGNLGVACRRLQLAVTEQDLNDAEVGAALQKVGGEAVSKHVRCYGLADPRPSPCGTTCRLDRRDADMAARLLAWEQP